MSLCVFFYFFFYVGWLIHLPRGSPPLKYTYDVGFTQRRIYLKRKKGGKLGEDVKTRRFVSLTTYGCKLSAQENEAAAERESLSEAYYYNTEVLLKACP